MTFTRKQAINQTLDKEDEPFQVGPVSYMKMEADRLVWLMKEYERRKKLPALQDDIEDIICETKEIAKRVYEFADMINN